MIFGTVGIGVVAIVSVTGILIKKVVKDANERESLKDLEKNIQQILMSRTNANEEQRCNDENNDNNIEENIGLDRSYKPISIKEKFKRNIEDRYKKDVMFDDYKDEYDDIDDNYDNAYLDNKHKRDNIDDSYEKMREFEKNFFKKFRENDSDIKNDINGSNDLDNKND